MSYLSYSIKNGHALFDGMGIHTENQFCPGWSENKLVRPTSISSLAWSLVQNMMSICFQVCVVTLKPPCYIGIGSRAEGKTTKELEQPTSSTYSERESCKYWKSIMQEKSHDDGVEALSRHWSFIHIMSFGFMLRALSLIRLHMDKQFAGNHVLAPQVYQRASHMEEWYWPEKLLYSTPMLKVRIPISLPTKSEPCGSPMITARISTRIPSAKSTHLSMHRFSSRDQYTSIS